MRELADRLGLATSIVTRLVDQLEAAGLAERRSHAPTAGVVAQSVALPAKRDSEGRGRAASWGGSRRGYLVSLRPRVDHARMLEARVRARGCGLMVLLLTGVGGVASAGQAARPASMAFRLLAAALAPPTPADFVGYPSCMIYAAGADTRIRVRAARASAVCTTLSRQLSGTGVRWSLKPQRLRHILSPICRFAGPRGQLELEVVDAAANSTRGQRICAGLARVGWVDLSRP